MGFLAGVNCCAMRGCGPDEGVELTVDFPEPDPEPREELYPLLLPLLLLYWLYDELEVEEEP